MVPQVQAPGRRRGVLLNLRFLKRKKSREAQLPSPDCVFLEEATRISERRRLCDAKTQLTIPGAQPSPSISSSLPPALDSLR